MIVMENQKDHKMTEGTAAESVENAFLLRAAVRRNVLLHVKN